MDSKQRESQNQKVLRHLQDKGTITSWEAIKKFKITRLSGRIYDLRNKGWLITAERKTTPQGKNFAEYTYCGREK